MAVSWRVENMRRCPLNSEHWVADVVYTFQPGLLDRWFLKRTPKSWKRMVRSGRHGQPYDWFWLPEVQRLQHHLEPQAAHLIMNHEWDLCLTLYRTRDEAKERERLDKERRRVLAEHGLAHHRLQPYSDEQD